MAQRLVEAFQLEHIYLFGLVYPSAKDVLVWTHDEFDRRTYLPASLPATILREGVLLYAK